MDQFTQLNSSIETALAMQDFDVLRRIDGARRRMLQEFASSSVPDGDKAFFESLEKCAADNARAITSDRRNERCPAPYQPADAWLVRIQKSAPSAESVMSQAGFVGLPGRQTAPAMTSLWPAALRLPEQDVQSSAFSSFQSALSGATSSASAAWLTIPSDFASAASIRTTSISLRWRRISIESK